jgi:putative transposase
VAFVDEHRDEFGVESICKALRVAPSTYYAAKGRVPSARTLRDAVMGPIVLAIWTANYRVVVPGSCGRPPGVPATRSAVTRWLGS